MLALKANLGEVTQAAHQRERKLVMSTYSQLEELTEHLSRQNEQQVSPLHRSTRTSHVRCLSGCASAHRHTVGADT